MPFKIIFFILPLLWPLLLPLLLGGCSLTKKQDCQKSSVQAFGLKDGQNGFSKRFDHIFVSCKDPSDLKSLYSFSYTKGLERFCTRARGEEQASLGLSKEAVCKNVAAYSSGYTDFLKKECNSKKAISDAAKLFNNDNRLCLTIPVYKKKYLQRLKRTCSFNRGKELGKNKKKIGQKCSDSKTSNLFKRGHRAGLSQVFKAENKKIRIKISKLKTKRKNLKKNLSLKLKAQDTQSIQKIRIELNVLESKILELEYKIETNKKQILK